MKEKMLKALTSSNNELIRERAKLALKGIEIDSGGFFNSVLKGDIKLAKQLADNDNLEVLKNIN